MLLEHERPHIGRIHLRIHDGEMAVRELRGHFLDRFLLGKPDADDQVKLALRKRPQHGLEGIVVGRFDVFQENSELGLGLGGSLVGRRVE